MARSVDDLAWGQVEDSDEGFQQYADAVSRHFHETANRENDGRWRQVTEFDRTYVARDGERIVGNSAAFSFRMSLAGGRDAGCAGITAVGVANDWRRRGLLTRMMRWHLEDARSRGEPFSTLYASESPIYGRFGYGSAAPSIDVRIERPWAQLVPPADAGLDVELVDAATAKRLAPPVMAAHREVRAGMMSRDERWWSSWFDHDPPGTRDGMSERRHAVVGDRGYAIYRVKPDWAEGLPKGEVFVIEVIAVDPEAYAALWQHLFSIDLTRTIRSSMEPVDLPLLSMVDNHQRLRVSGSADLYVRLVDVGAALGARAYHHDDTLTFAVDDPFTGWNTGVWRLEVADGEGTCERVDADPDRADLALDVRELAAICLGGVRATQHVWARRILERTPGAAARADRLFATELAPWNPFEF